MSLTVAEIAQQLNAEVIGTGELRIDGVESIDKAGPGDLTFVTDDTNVKKLIGSQAGAALFPPALLELLPEEQRPPAIILVDQPKAAFIKIMVAVRPRRPRSDIGVSPRAFVSESARIGAGTNVYPGAYIADDVVIGEGCDIHPGVHVGPGCRIGNGVVLHPNVVLYHDIQIGNNVIINACSVIGADGFGYHLVEGRHEKIPHMGTVQIDEEVEIGSCTTIDRGMIGPTIIGAGSKLDNLVVVAHNCELGKHNLFVSQVGLAGSVTTGDYVVCAGQVGVADHVHLGDGCVLGAKAGVHKDMPGHQTYLGAPAEPAEEAVRNVMSLRKVPELRRQMRNLIHEVDALKQKLEEISPENRESASGSAA